MEALAAVGLASNILQFLDFCNKVVSGSSEIYHSLSGTSGEYESLEQMCQFVSELSAGLIPPQSPQELEKLPPALRPSKMEIDLARLALRCKEASDRLLNDLSDSRLDSTSRGRAASLWQSVKNALGRSRVRALQKTVENYRKDLMLCLQAVTVCVYQLPWRDAVQPSRHLRVY
jgi:hypothetical protein